MAFFLKIFLYCETFRNKQKKKTKDYQISMLYILLKIFSKKFFFLILESSIHVFRFYIRIYAWTF